MRYAKEYTVPQHIVDQVWEIVKVETNITNMPIQQIEMFQEEFKIYLRSTDAHENLDTRDGMVCFKFNPENNIPLEGQIILSTAMFHLVNSCLYSPAPEPKNRLPYTTFKSSAKSPEKMMAAGVKFYTPDEKLGYHNDVFYQDGKYFIPKYVGLINLFIGYEAPGNFYYINQKIWRDFEIFFSKGIGQKFKFRPTPVVYESHIEQQNAKSLMDDWVDVPVFWNDPSGRKVVFSNGELKDNNDTTIISELKKSLLENEDKLAIPQKTNQIMIFRNDLGFHSRDIFREQRVFEGTTRLFLRAVSEEHIAVPV